MIYPDTELSLLESISETEGLQTHATQRELANLAGLSLGMTNSLLRRLAERGLVKLTRLSPRSMRYALTPEGFGELLRRTSGYFRRAARNVDKYRARIEMFIAEAKREGASTLVLAGSSELDFLIEFVCERHRIAFVKTADLERARNLCQRSGVAMLYAEMEETFPVPGASYLRDIISQLPKPAVMT